MNRNLKLLSLNLGQSINLFLKPFNFIEESIEVEVKKVSIFDISKKSQTIFSSATKIPQETVNHIRSYMLTNTSKENSEIWHKSYPNKDDGLLIDQNDIISNFIQELRSSRNYSLSDCFYDKVMLRWQDDLSLGSFHCDHFSGNSSYIRKKFEIKRSIINLDYYPRYLAIWDVEDRLVMNNISDPFDAKEYSFLLKNKLSKNRRIFLVEIPEITKNTAYSVDFMAFSCLHCGFGKKGDFGAVLTYIQ